MEVHFSDHISFSKTTPVPVWWSPIGSSQWHKGHIKVWGKGFVCVITEDQRLIWLPRKWIKIRYKEELLATWPSEMAVPGDVPQPVPSLE